MDDAKKYEVEDQLREIAQQVRENPTAREKVAEAIEVIALTIGHMLEVQANLIAAMQEVLNPCEDCAAKEQATVEANGGPL